MCAQLRLTLCNPMDCVACQPPLSMEFSRQEYWSGLPLPNPEDLPDPGIKLMSPASPASAGRLFLRLGHLRSPLVKPINPKAISLRKSIQLLGGKDNTNY